MSEEFGLASSGGDSRRVVEAVEAIEEGGRRERWAWKRLRRAEAEEVVLLPELDPELLVAGKRDDRDAILKTDKLYMRLGKKMPVLEFNFKDRNLV